MEKPWLIDQNNWKSVMNTRFEVIVLPWGANEAHNYHLPYGTDNFLAAYVADKSAGIAWQKGIRVGVLPVIPFGVNTGQMDLQLTINLNPSTQFKILEDITETLSRQGFRKIVVFNAHGGNDFRQMIRELQPRYPEIFICQLNWYAAVPPEDYFEDTGEHAGEAETSAMMVVRPDLVRPLTEAGNGKNKRLRFSARKEGWMWAPRPWSVVSRDTGIGDPRKASSAKRERYLRDAINKTPDFLVELGQHSPDEFYTD
jgi:creatinine amidohydrolase